MKYILQFPLLALVLIAFNVAIHNNPDALQPHGAPLFGMTLPSGETWLPSTGDLLVIIGVGLLYLELFKATRTSVESIFEHILSLLVFLAFLIQFIVYPPAANSTCVILMLISLLDVIGGFTISISTARRDMSFGG